MVWCCLVLRSNCFLDMRQIFHLVCLKYALFSTLERCLCDACGAWTLPSMKNPPCATVFNILSKYGIVLLPPWQRFWFSTSEVVPRYPFFFTVCLRNFDILLILRTPRIRELWYWDKSKLNQDPVNMDSGPSCPWILLLLSSYVRG